MFWQLTVNDLFAVPLLEFFVAVDPKQGCSFVGMNFPIHQVKNYDFAAGYNDVDEFHRSM